jgi:hypothetical protein
LVSNVKELPELVSSVECFICFHLMNGNAFLFLISRSHIRFDWPKRCFIICCSLILSWKVLRICWTFCNSCEIFHHSFFIARNLYVELYCYACSSTLTYCSTVYEYNFVFLFFVGNSSLDAHDGGTTAPWVTFVPWTHMMELRIAIWLTTKIICWELHE